MSPIVFWISAYVICGLISFICLMNFAPRTAANWKVICQHGMWGAFVGFTLVTVLWLPTLIFGCVYGFLDYRRAVRRAGIASATLGSVQSLVRPGGELELIEQEARQIRDESHAGFPVDPARLGALESRIRQASKVVAAAMIALLDGVCPRCGNPVREMSYPESAGARCDKCGTSFPYHKMNELAQELIRERRGIWRA